MLIPVPTRAYWTSLWAMSQDSRWQRFIHSVFHRRTKDDQRKCLGQEWHSTLNVITREWQKDSSHGFLKESFVSATGCSGHLIKISRETTPQILSLIEWSAPIFQRHKWWLRDKNVNCLLSYIHHGCCSMRMPFHRMLSMAIDISGYWVRQDERGRERERNWWMVYCWVIFLLNNLSFSFVITSWPDTKFLPLFS